MLTLLICFRFSFLFVCGGGGGGCGSCLQRSKSDREFSMTISQEPLNPKTSSVILNFSKNLVVELKCMVYIDSFSCGLDSQLDSDWFLDCTLTLITVTNSDTELKEDKKYELFLVVIS